MTVALERRPFGETADGRAVELFTFTHENGLVLAVANYGCVIQSLLVPDRDGISADIVLGYDTLAEYEADERFLGCVVGRYANRIAHGRFSIDGVSYQLETNNSHGHHIHGGTHGFNSQVWQASVAEMDGLPLLELRHDSPDGHGGYPGNLKCLITYQMTSVGEIEISYHATTDRPTVVNLTNHSYFNLRGHECAIEGGVHNHLVKLNCDKFLPSDEALIPSSDPISVAGTTMDFRTEKPFAAGINETSPYLVSAGGYDHTWVIQGETGAIRRAATVADPESGRSLEVSTTQPGIQVYTANALDALGGKGGAIYQRRGSVCLETQHYPDSPNQPGFPSTLVTVDKPYQEVTVFKPGIR